VRAHGQYEYTNERCSQGALALGEESTNVRISPFSPLPRGAEGERPVPARASGEGEALDPSTHMRTIDH